MNLVLPRRTLLKSAATSLLLPATARAKPRGGGGGGLVWRGSGQNMRQTVQGYGGGASWSNCCRSRHYSAYPFRYARFVLPTFDNIPVSGPTIADKNFASNFNFQLGVEFPWTLGATGIPARNAVTFGGSGTAGYTTSSGPFGYILSDVYDFGQVVPAGTFFGLWTTIENAAGTGSAGNTLPYQVNGTDGGFATRYQGSTQAASSLIAANTTLNATSITPYTVAGSGTVFTPCMMLILIDATRPHVFGLGDSICYGVGEGGAGSSGYGDYFGSSLANAGYPARWVYETLGHNFVNMGRGSDGYKFFSTSNWQYRLDLLTLANPTHVLMQNGHNDLGAGNAGPQVYALAAPAYAAVRAAVPSIPLIGSCVTPDSGAITSPAWAAGISYTVGAFIAGPYVCRTSGTSAASASGPAGTGSGIADGTVVWDYIFAGAAGAQSATNYWGSSASHRGNWNNNYVRANGGLNNAGWIDVNPAMESGYNEGVTSSETSLWACPRNIANDETIDGTHPNSYATASAIAAIYASVAGAQVSDPFLHT